MRTVLLMMLLLSAGAGCSGSSSDNDKADKDDSNATNNASNNATNSTNSDTNSTTGTNNAPGTNNQPGTNNTTATNNEPQPRDPFTGICAVPDTTVTDDGCNVSWRCSSQLTLACVDDGTGTATCACTKDGVAANSFTGPTQVPCEGDQEVLTQLAADQCSWGISYMSTDTLNCAAGVQVSGRSMCSWTWDCGGMDYKFDCVDDRNGGLDCTCMIDNRPTGMAFPTNNCGNSEPSAIRTARAGCGWDITTN